MARITVDELKVIITADVKELDKALSKSGKTVKDYVKELKDTSKNTEAVDEKTEGLADGLKGMADGLLKGITGLGGLSVGAVAAGAAVAKLALEIGQVGYQAYTQFNQLNDYMAATGTQSKAIMSQFTNSVKGMAVDYKQALLAIAPAVERLNIPLPTGDYNKMKASEKAIIDYWALTGAKIAKLAEDTGADASALSASFTTVEQRWRDDGIDFAETADIIYTAAKKANAAPGMMADAIANVSPTFQRFGYTLGETAGIVARFLEQGLNPEAFAGLLKRNISEFGDDAESARIELTRLISTVTQLDKEGRYGAIDSLLATYGLSEKDAETLRLAARAGVFKGGAYEGAAVYKMPEPDIENWGDWFQMLGNKLAIGLKSAFEWAFDRAFNNEIVTFKPEPIEYQGIDIGEMKTKYENLMDVVNGMGIKYSREEISYLLENPNAYAKWKMDADRWPIPEAGTILRKYSPYSSGGAGGTNFIDWLEKQLQAVPQKNSSLPFGVDAEAWAMYKATKGVYGENPLVGGAADTGEDAGYFGGYGVGPSLNEKEQASKDELLISDRTSQALITDSRLVLQHRLEDFGTWRRSSEATFGAVTSISREAAESSAQSFYTLKTAFGDINFDITKMSKALEEWGIDVPAVIDNIVTGVKRLGKEWLESMGLEDSYEKLVEWANEAGEIYKQFQAEVGIVWDAVVEKSYMGAEEAAKAMETLGKDAISKMKELVGTVVTTLSEGFATGKMNWKKLWQETWTSLLNILVEWGVKALLTFAATEQGMLAIKAVTAAILGDWKTAALAAVGIASVVAGIAASIAAIKAIGNALPDGAEDDEGSGGKDPWWNPDPDAYKPGAQQPGRPEGSGPGASSVEASGRPNVVVHIHNPQYMGQFSDSDAAAFGQAFGEALIVRGVMPQPIG